MKIVAIDNEEMILKLWKRLFEKAGIDIVLFQHLRDVPAFLEYNDARLIVIGRVHEHENPTGWVRGMIPRGIPMVVVTAIQESKDALMEAGCIAWSETLDVIKLVRQLEAEGKLAPADNQE